MNDTYKGIRHQVPRECSFAFQECPLLSLGGWWMFRHTSLRTFQRVSIRSCLRSKCTEMFLRFLWRPFCLPAEMFAEALLQEFHIPVIDMVPLAASKLYYQWSSRSKADPAVEHDKEFWWCFSSHPGERLGIRIEPSQEFQDSSKLRSMISVRYSGLGYVKFDG